MRDLENRRIPNSCCARLYILYCGILRYTFSLSTVVASTNHAINDLGNYQRASYIVFLTLRMKHLSSPKCIAWENKRHL